MVDRFPVVLRGYDKEKVDAAFDATQESIKRAQQTLASMREQIAADDDRILQLQAQLQEEKNKKPEGNSFASLGANAQQMLASAEQTSTELLERAKQDASSIRTTAQAQAETLINNAKLDAQHIVDDANAKAASILTNASNQAESVTTSANEDAAQLRSETAKTITEQRQTVELELS
ncbi:DivIVA domain-containing protein, partial [Bifidobacterium breve]|uniref:DivIVA domain-containing protein n=1 Tax=Bifidobacterium breve TaxID=1685 RepID=UPI0021176CBB